MEKLYLTTDEQSDRLIACGINSVTADVWISGRPRWSITKILELLPPRLEDFQCDSFYDLFSGELSKYPEDPYTISGELTIQKTDNGKWYIDYQWDGFNGILPQGNSLLEAALKAIELLYANGYKFNK